MTCINLLPWRENLHKKQQRIFYKIVSFSILMAVLFILIVHMVIVTDIKHQKQKNQLLKTQITQLDHEIIWVSQLKKQINKAVSHKNTMQNLINERFRMVFIFDAISNVLPEDIYLLEVSQKSDELILFGKATSNEKISLLLENINVTAGLSDPLLLEIKQHEKANFFGNSFKLKMKTGYDFFVNDSAAEKSDK